jgi:uncharacterized membrane protein YadS
LGSIRGPDFVSTWITVLLTQSTIAIPGEATTARGWVRARVAAWALAAVGSERASTRMEAAARRALGWVMEVSFQKRPRGGIAIGV